MQSWSFRLPDIKFLQQVIAWFMHHYETVNGQTLYSLHVAISISTSSACIYIYIVTACHFQAVVPYTHWARLARGYFLLRWVRRVFYLHWISEPCQAQHRKHHKAVIVFHVTSCGCHFNIAANMPTNDQNIQVAASMKTGLLSICDATFGWCLTKLLTSASSSMEPARAFPRDLLQRSKIHSCLYDIPTQLYIHIDLRKTGYQSIEDPCWF